MPNTDKICCRCNLSKPLLGFPLASSCKDGHRNYCKDCEKIAKAQRRAKNLAHHNAKGKAWALANPEKRKQARKKYYDANREKCDLLAKEWKQNNKEAVRLATPKWADMRAIKEIYRKAMQLKLEVDHEIPLQGELVSGLHVPSNLRLVTKSENSSKGNRYAV
jgi:hypothetical protein